MGEPRRFVIIRPGDGPPPNVLTWQSSAERRRLLRAWRDELFKVFGDESRCVRLGWVLIALAEKHGYAFATDERLAEYTFMPRNKVADTLTRMERGGAIVRLQKPNGKSLLRLIYLHKPPFPDTPNRGEALHPSGEGDRL